MKVCLHSSQRRQTGAVSIQTAPQAECRVNVPKDSMKGQDCLAGRGLARLVKGGLGGFSGQSNKSICCARPGTLN